MGFGAGPDASAKFHSHRGSNPTNKGTGRGYEFSSTVSRYQVVQVCGCHVILGELCGPQ
jgi:hypothetical protein